MSLPYLLDEDNKKVAVLLKMKDWLEAEKKIKAYDIALSIMRGLKEVEQIETGKLKPKDTHDLLNEL